MALSVDRNGGAAISSGEAGLDGIFKGEEISDREVTTRIVGRSRPESVRGWKSSSGSEKTEKQSSQGGKIECIAAWKKIITSLNRGIWSYSLVKLRRTHYMIDMLFFFISIVFHII